MTAIDVELMHAWMRADAPACCVALAKLGAEERAAALIQCEAGDLALLLRHAPVWWLNVVQTELPDLPWNEAIVEAGRRHQRDSHVAWRATRGTRTSACEFPGTPARAYCPCAGAAARPSVVCARRPSSDRAPERNRRDRDEPDRSGCTPKANPGSISSTTSKATRGKLPLSMRRAHPLHRSMADLPLVQRPVLHSVLLLDHAMRLPDWQIHDSLPVLDEAERFAGVLRLGDLVQCVAPDRCRSESTTGESAGADHRFVGRTAGRADGPPQDAVMMLSDEVLNAAPDVAISVLTRQSEAELLEWIDEGTVQRAVVALRHLDADTAGRLIEEFPAKRRADVIAAMEPRDAFRCLRTIPRRRREALVASLPPRGTTRSRTHPARARRFGRRTDGNSAAARDHSYARRRMSRARATLSDAARADAVRRRCRRQSRRGDRPAVADRRDARTRASGR